MKTSVLLVTAALVVGACTAPASSSPTPTASLSATLAPSPTVTPSPTTVRGSALVPPVVSRAQYGDMGITLDVPDRTGQPAEDMVWHVDPFRPAPGYPARVASVLGLTGPGIAGDVPAGGAPGSNGPWRLWFGDKVLAVNETSGEAYYFDPSATDGPAPAGPARRDPADALRLLLRDFGWTADLDASPTGIAVFRGTEVTARAEHIINGSWLRPGYRETAVLFPRYPHPTEPTRLSGPRIYGSDHLALLTSQGRPAEIIHRPAGQITRGEIYPITPFGQARSELLASPLRYLHFLSNPTGEPLKLTVRDAYQGAAWTGFSGSGLTHAGQLLVPVWVFPASGTTASGLPVDAIFIVDAVVRELRAQGRGGTTNVSADTLIRYQLATLGGQNTELLTARGAIRHFLNTDCGPIIEKEDADSASGTVTCGRGPTITFTVKRAFRGLASSIWYLSESRK
ncbi:MAG: hypothetical protein ACRDG6_13940 [Candidatus Limnocylindria bacterium]